MNICYLSFPDSNSGCMGDSKFHIKVRSRFNESCRIQRHQRKCLVEYNHVCPQWNQRAEAASHIYGFVYFRQTKNAQIKRGYFQKSIVLLTRLPFINLFYRLSDLIAPIFFQQPTEMDRMALLSLIFQVTVIDEEIIYKQNNDAYFDVITGDWSMAQCSRFIATEGSVPC